MVSPADFDRLIRWGREEVWFETRDLPGFERFVKERVTSLAERNAIVEFFVTEAFVSLVMELEEILSSAHGTFPTTLILVALAELLPLGGSQVRRVGRVRHPSLCSTTLIRLLRPWCAPQTSGLSRPDDLVD